MTAPVETIRADDYMFHAIARMRRRHLRHMPMIDGSGAVLGVLDLHRAFDASAGRRVLAEDVPIFLASHQVFKPLKPDIVRFFATSRRAFFGNDVTGAAEDMPLVEVADLGKRLGEAERRAA